MDSCRGFQHLCCISPCFATFRSVECSWSSQNLVCLSVSLMNIMRPGKVRFSLSFFDFNLLGNNESFGFETAISFNFLASQISKCFQIHSNSMHTSVLLKILKADKFAQKVSRGLEYPLSCYLYLVAFNWM